jgi:Gpi18-like mannosyltransferase
MIKILKELNRASLVLKILIASIILVRLYLFFEPSFKIDMGDWQGWTARIVDVGPLNFYSPQVFADYLPFFYLMLWILGKIFVFFFNNGAIASSLFPLYIKLISSFFDFGTALVIFAIVKKYSSKWASAAAIFYLINPGTIFISSVWGQVDSIPTFFLILSLYVFEQRSNIKQWSIFNTLSFLIKPLNAPILPITIVESIKNFSIKKNLQALFLAICLWYAISIPFFLNDPVFGVFKLLFKSLSVYPYASINAYNFWGLFGWWTSDTAGFLGLQLHTWGFVIYAVVLLVILLPLLKNKINKTEMSYFACMLSTFGFFVFLTRMHERTLFPFFALLVIVAFIQKSRWLLTTYVILSAVYFLDIFYSYYYYNFVFYNNLVSRNLLFEIAGNYRVVFCSINVVMFIVLLFFYFKKFYFLKKLK